jgi:hypothetical protein
MSELDIEYKEARDDIRDDRNTCSNCGHLRSEHCKGNVRHAHYKDEMRMVPKPRVSFCGGPHCEEALCSCVRLQ